ncbi:hypothetical protein BOTBODRAFT_34993 [Botryobasidium botryosum FD-172 SS1]|uniref:Dihydroorotate dehydrogenase (quinone), mitochondrial n=1 Tax=Botryobasidium botryosum (strain FD-172 SS1) TaxID=930990 RepID=A0A067MK38_BOTB1|nr:hypothetical protein BOTBODRAFT_34993 [Botryobasidium botryosum FD-172 SS1]
MTPETAHRFAVRVLGSGWAPQDRAQDDPSLGVQLWGHRLSSPIGLAAGFDKDAEAIEGLFGIGFSWVEVGSVTPKPQPGNPRPRFFHLPEDSAIINRYGFPSRGAHIVLSHLRSYLAKYPPSSAPDRILAVNLGKNKSSPPDDISDFINGVRTFGPLSDVLVINVSSPNTPGLRGLQNRGMLEELLAEVIKTRNGLAERKDGWKWAKPKIVLKIAPDLDKAELEDVAEVVKASGVDGVIVSNTTIQRPSSLISAASHEQGGLSGPPLYPLSLKAFRTLRSLLPPSIPLIGCGGITTGRDALEFAEAGATLVQVYTAFGYDGVGFPRRIKDQLQHELTAGGKTWEEISKGGAERFGAKPLRAEDAEDVLKNEGKAFLQDVENLEKVLVELDQDISSALSELEQGSQPEARERDPSGHPEAHGVSESTIAHSTTEPALLEPTSDAESASISATGDVPITLAPVKPADDSCEAEAEIATAAAATGDVKTI